MPPRVAAERADGGGSGVGWCGIDGQVVKTVTSGAPLGCHDDCDRVNSLTAPSLRFSSWQHKNRISLCVFHRDGIVEDSRRPPRQLEDKFGGLGLEDLCSWPRLARPLHQLTASFFRDACADVL